MLWFFYRNLISFNPFPPNNNFLNSLNFLKLKIIFSSSSGNELLVSYLVYQTVTSSVLSDRVLICYNPLKDVIRLYLKSSSTIFDKRGAVSGVRNWSFVKWLHPINNYKKIPKSSSLIEISFLFWTKFLNNSRMSLHDRVLLYSFKLIIIFFFYEESTWCITSLINYSGLMSVVHFELDKRLLGSISTIS
jgi:hypothetical protein